MEYKTFVTVLVSLLININVFLVDATDLFKSGTASDGLTKQTSKLKGGGEYKMCSSKPLTDRVMLSFSKGVNINGRSRTNFYVSCDGMIATDKFRNVAGAFKGKGIRAMSQSYQYDVFFVYPSMNDVAGYVEGRVSTDATELARATDLIRSFYSVPYKQSDLLKNFTASELLIVTWDKVRYYDGGSSSTFQAVFARDGINGDGTSAAMIYLFQDVGVSKQVNSAQKGYALTGWMAANGGDSNRVFPTCHNDGSNCQCIDDMSYVHEGPFVQTSNNLTCQSNARAPGVLVYQLSEVQSECAKAETGNWCPGQNVDDCKLTGTTPNECSLLATCTDLPGPEKECACLPGTDAHATAGFNCTDINECENVTICHAMANCNNLSPGYNCTCKPGYEGDGKTKCIDSNECLNGKNKCSKHANCTNTIGSYNCTCKPGFTSTDGGITCKDTDECTDPKLNECHMNATCKNIDGSYTCECNRGFTDLRTGIEKAGHSCDIDECASKDTNDCHDNAKCSNLIGSYNCSCKSGFLGDGRKKCDDVDECKSPELNKCHVNATCNNTDGSYVCKCFADHFGDGYMCLGDENECLNASRHNCHSNADCYDITGSFKCECKDGFAGDGVNKCEDVNECLSKKDCHGNAHCNNTIGSYNCTCNHGYAGDGKICLDVNECKAQNGSPCSPHANCFNSEGGYSCKCKPGFNGNGHFCQDVNECNNSTLHGCHEYAHCNNTIGSHDCICNQGYGGIGDKLCFEIDECTDSLVKHDCDDKTHCRNKNGSFECICPHGHKGVNGRNCTDVNECLLKNDCHDNAHCNNTIGSYNCTCDRGHRGNGLNCTDIDECKEKHDCHANATCNNLVGTFKCDCRDGFDGDGRNCTDIDECAPGIMDNVCHPHARCINSHGGEPTCVCRTGWSGNGTICDDVNECNGGHQCDANAHCNNTMGGHNCTCNPGFMGDGVDGTCKDINECKNASMNSCHDNADCHNLEPSYNCSCKEGYSGDGRSTCDDVDECVTGKHKCHTEAHCNNTVGEHNCTCNQGFHGDGRNCNDTNECSRDDWNSCVEDADCTNSKGSYSCACTDGHAGDGKVNCTDVNECAPSVVHTYCHKHAECENVKGGHNCTCKDGYEGNGTHCSEINECSKPETNDCHDLADCRNTNASFTCECKEGYNGTGRDTKAGCEDVDECGTGKHKCHLKSHCNNTVGGYNCTCNQGFYGDGMNCNDTNECLDASKHDCHSNATCSNLDGTFNCSCKEGYVGDGRSNCNETCAVKICEVNADCSFNGHYAECFCQSGYYKSGGECVRGKTFSSSITLTQTFDANLLDKSSSEYKALEAKVYAEILAKFKAQFPNMKGVVILGFKEGSVVVMFTIIMDKDTDKNATDVASGINVVVSGGGLASLGANTTAISTAIESDPCYHSGTAISKCDGNSTCTRVGLKNYTCECIQGFKGSGQPGDCVYSDTCPYRCKYELGQECHQLSGICSCQSGYTAQGLKCIDYNECLPNQDPCKTIAHTTCVNLPGTHRCDCNAGYYSPSVNSTTNPVCEDYDECLNTTICGTDHPYNCSNTIGSYVCIRVCRAGWAGSDCTSDINECKSTAALLDGTLCGGEKCNSISGVCGNTTCFNTRGSYTCSCKSGHYTGDPNVECHDLNDCLPNVQTNHTCHENATCHNQLAASHTCTCNEGFMGNGENCSNVNECENATLNDCHSNATCHDNIGSFTCNCKNGFNGNGTSCTDIEECNIGGSCDANANCTNSIGSFACKCHDGFNDTGSALPGECKDVNECTHEVWEHNCHANATCSNTHGGHNCTCKPGFKGDGVNCTDLNECTELNNSCVANAHCNNTFGKFECTCNNGFRGSGYHENGTGCNDINECLNPGICIDLANCTNLNGTYDCKCRLPYAGNGYAGGECVFSMLAGTSENLQNLPVIHEQDVEVAGLFNEKASFKAIFLSTVSGKMPGTVVQNKPLSGTKLGLLYFSSSDMRPEDFYWLGMNEALTNDGQFQSGHRIVMYQVEEKCVQIDFTQTMTSTPVVILQLYAAHKLNPFFLDYSLAWAVNVTQTGFRACLHEAVLFSGNHTAQISYMALAGDVPSIYSLSEADVLSFPVGNLSCDSEMDLSHFCKRYAFKKRYVNPKVKLFVSSELDANATGAGEQATWILRATNSYAYICTKNTEDDSGHRNFHANVSIVISGGETNACNEKLNDPGMKNLDCYIDKNNSTYFDCIKPESCQTICNSQHCSSDYGTYLTKCHAQAETCSMYGKQHMISLTFEDGKCSKLRALNSLPLPALEAATRELTMESDRQHVFCSKVELNATSFHNYSDILVVTSATFPERESHEGFQPSFAAWSENVTHDSFIGCVKSTSRSNGTRVPSLSYLAYQKNVHRRVSERGDETYAVRGGAAELVGNPQGGWRRGARCKKIEHGLKLSEKTKLMVSAKHRNSHEWDHSLATWVEVNAEKTQDDESLVCAQSLELFGSRRRNIDLNWIVVNVNPAVNNSVDVQSAINKNIKSEHTSHTEMNRHNSTCTDLPKYDASRVSLVGVKAMVPENIFKQETSASRNSLYSSWIEVETDVTKASACQQASWSGASAFNTTLQLLSFKDTRHP